MYASIADSNTALSLSFQSENKRLENDSDSMKRELATEKEKLHTLELAVENLGKIGG